MKFGRPRLSILAPAMVLIAICFFMPATAECARPKKKTVDALVLQQADELFGKRTIYLSDDAFRIEWPMADLIVISKRPYTSLDLFNEASKKAVRVTPKRLIEQLSVFEFGLYTDLFDSRWHKKGTARVTGLPSSLFWVALDDTIAPDVASAQGLSYCKYWILEAPRLTPDAIHVISSYAGLPPLGGVPLRLEYYCKFKELNSMGLQRSNVGNDCRTFRRFLDTTDSERKLVSPALFISPAGLSWNAPLDEVTGAKFRKRTGAASEAIRVKAHQFFSRRKR